MSMILELPLILGSISSFCSAAAYVAVRLGRERTERLRCQEAAKINQERLKRGMDAYTEAVREGREVDLVQLVEVLVRTDAGRDSDLVRLAAALAREVSADRQAPAGEDQVCDPPNVA